jgi:hypothetical protein
MPDVNAAGRIAKGKGSSLFPVGSRLRLRREIAKQVPRICESGVRVYPGLRHRTTTRRTGFFVVRSRSYRFGPGQAGLPKIDPRLQEDVRFQ